MRVTVVRSSEMIEIIEILLHREGKQSKEQYGGDPSENYRLPFPPVAD
jgi:hypothetical protein